MSKHFPDGEYHAVYESGFSGFSTYYALKEYKIDCVVLRSIPEIGCIVAMTILTEIYDVSRFKNERQFASYLGLIPTSHSSCEKESHGEKTFRGNKQLGPMLIETCRVSISRDYGLGQAYIANKQKMKPQEAIVKVTRKMSNIIFSVLKNKKEYEPYKWEN